MKMQKTVTRQPKQNPAQQMKIWANETVGPVGCKAVRPLATGLPETNWALRMCCNKSLVSENKTHPPSSKPKCVREMDWSMFMRKQRNKTIQVNNKHHEVCADTSLVHRFCLFSLLSQQTFANKRKRQDDPILKSNPAVCTYARRCVVQSDT